MAIKLMLMVECVSGSPPNRDLISPSVGSSHASDSAVGAMTRWIRNMSRALNSLGLAQWKTSFAGRIGTPRHVFPLKCCRAQVVPCLPFRTNTHAFIFYSEPGERPSMSCPLILWRKVFRKSKNCWKNSTDEQWGGKSRVLQRLPLQSLKTADVGCANTGL